MDHDKLFSIIDYGSSKFRLGAFNYKNDGSKYVTNNINFNNDENFKNLILDLENNINRHLKNLTIMIDSKNCFSVDVAIKKKLDKNTVNKKKFNNFVNEVKLLVEQNYLDYKIQHLIISKYIVDDREYEDFIEIKNIENLIIEIKLILIPSDIINNLRNLLKKSHISIINIFNSSYVKALDYNKNFDKYETKFYLDIGFEKTSLLIFKKNKLVHINFLPLGGKHLTNDIAQVLKIDEIEAEELKLEMNQTNTTINSEDSNKLLIQVVHARLQEIIDLSLKSVNDLEYLKSTKAVLIFTGDGSKILSKNSIFLNEEYNFFSKMNCFEESADIICSAGLNYLSSKNLFEYFVVSKKIRKKGFFERLFYYFNR